MLIFAAKLLLLPRSSSKRNWGDVVQKVYSAQTYQQLTSSKMHICQYNKASIVLLCAKCSLVSLSRGKKICQAVNISRELYILGRLYFSALLYWQRTFLFVLEGQRFSLTLKPTTNFPQNKISKTKKKLF